MSKVVAIMSMSLDGYVADPNDGDNLRHCTLFSKIGDCVQEITVTTKYAQQHRGGSGI